MHVMGVTTTCLLFFLTIEMKIIKNSANIGKKNSNIPGILYLVYLGGPIGLIMASSLEVPF